VKILFSGDTVIDKRHWGSMALPIAWGRLMLSLSPASSNAGFYWLLTSKGYKTYRFLPVFFREFYPRYDAQTPEFERVLLASAAAARMTRATVSRHTSLEMSRPIWVSLRLTLRSRPRSASAPSVSS